MDNDLQEVLTTLIEEALSGEPLKFELITSMPEYGRFRFRRKALKATVKVLDACANSVLDGYCAQVLLGEQDVTKLLAYETLCQAVAFYEKDLLTVDQMLGEYEIYLMAGHQLDFLFFKTRKESELWDYRRFLN